MTTTTTTITTKMGPSIPENESKTPSANHFSVRRPHYTRIAPLIVARIREGRNVKTPSTIQEEKIESYFPITVTTS